MNAYLTLVNLIKNNLSDSWMTPSQKRVYDDLIDTLSHHGYINLYGPTGSGKTFLGWLLHKNRLGNYFPHLSLLEPNIELAIVDNVLERRESFRQLVKEVQLTNIRRLIAISREPIDDYVISIKLDCQITDIEKMASNLCVAQSESVISEFTNLWDLYRFLIAEEKLPD